MADVRSCDLQAQATSRASISTKLQGLVTDIYTVSTTCVSRTDSEKGQDLTADELFNFETVAKRDVFLSFSKAPRKRTRWFCGRCGTSLAYYGDANGKDYHLSDHARINTYLELLFSNTKFSTLRKG